MEDVVFQEGTPDEIRALGEQLEALKAEKAEYEAELEPLKEEIAAIDEQRAEARRQYEATIAKFLDDERRLKAERMERNNLIAQMRQKVASAERQLHDAMRVERLKAEEAEKSKALNDAMVMAKWFTAAFQHQFDAAKKITIYRKMILADAPGLGKTLTALAACDLIAEATKDSDGEWPYGFDYDNKVLGVPHQAGRKILYVCPAPLLRNVLREVRMWTDRSPVLMGNQPRATRRMQIDILNDMSDFVVIINYEAWRRDKMLLADLKNLQFDTVILDEAHTLKDRNTDAYRSIKSLLAHRDFPRNITDPGYLADVESGKGYYWKNKPSNSYVPFVIAMTGTPILNKPQDLFSLLTLVDPDHFTSESYFLRDYCMSDGGYPPKYVFRPGGLDSLARRISNVYLRRTKRDAGIVLPGKHEEIHELDLDEASYPDQARARKEMKRYGAIQLSGDKFISAAAEIAIYTRLRQIETWPAGIEIKDENHVVMLKLDVEESQKLDYVFKDGNNGLLADLCEGGLEEGSSCVVFSQFKAPLRELHRRLSAAGIKSVVLDGDTPQSLREEIIMDFDRRHTAEGDARWQVVLANYRVGGVGVTLTRATELIMLDSEWSSGREEQATDRVHRIGQTEDVTIHKILVKGTIDAWLDAIVSNKRNMTEGFNDKMDFSELRKFLEE